MRFAWRKDTAKRAKILRTVSFPPTLDVRNLCTPLLQSRIAAHCVSLEKERDEKAGVKPTEAEKPAVDEAADVLDKTPVQSAEEITRLAADSAGAECGDCRTGR